ncbi:MAG: peptidylprolyl isomerase [Myxococcales bacterium]|nr:peptidylprolyl isomerase [Myxococcales bacterium]
MGIRATHIGPLALWWLAAGCGSGQPAAGEPGNTTSAEHATGAPTEERPQDSTPAPMGPPEDNSEACGQIILSAYAGAKFAKPEVTRTAEQARKRAEGLRARIHAGEAFGPLATSHSEAPTSAPRGGTVGTYERSAWPDLHEAILDPLFGLAIGQVADQIIEAPYGFVVLKRCPVEKVRARHILVRYAGAKRAKGSITRSREQAREHAEALHAKLSAGANFAELARSHSEDGSAERGGDIGNPGRGLLALAFEQAVFALQPGEHSDVVETEFGFHVIERLPD